MLLSLAEIVQPAIAPMNSVIIKEDTTGQELYMIRAGEVEVTQSSAVDVKENPDGILVRNNTPACHPLSKPPPHAPCPM